MKRTLSLLLILVLLLGMLPITSVSAATYSGYEGSLKWNLDTSTGKLTISGNGAMPNNSNAYSYSWFNYEDYIKSVIIESGVTSIGDYAFYAYSNLTSLSLSNTVTSIGQYAFYNCDKLTSLTNTGYVTSLGRNAFYDCDALTSVTLSGQTTEMGMAVYANCDALTTVIIGNGAFIGSSAFADCRKLSSLYFSPDISYIGPSAFEDCDALTSVTLPTGLKTIDSAAFDNCNALSSITMPEGLETIGSFAFRNCDALSSIIIPSNVSQIGQNPFAGCDGLTGIYLDDGNEYYKSNYGVLYTKDGTELIAYPSGNTTASFSMLSTVTSIAPYAFYACSNLSNVYFSSSLTTIGNNAFEDCTGLRTVNVSGALRNINVQVIEDYAFSGCTTLLDVTINGIESIGKNAFEYCKTLYTLKINGSPKIEKEAFLNCYDLASLDLGGTYSIGERAFYGSGLSAYTLPASVRYVGREAFANCLETKKITVLNPGCQFYGMGYYETFSGLTSQTITFHGYENSSAKAYADLYGHSFTAHTFDENGKCTRCNYGRYTYDDGLWSFEADSGVAYIYGFETVPTYSYEGAQSWQDFNCAITDLVMGNDVKVISDSAFKDQTKMETLNLVNVEEIKPGAFSGCTSLERLYLPDTLKSLGEQAFYGCTSLLSAVLRPNLESVGYNAFFGCTTLLEVNVLNPNCRISDYKYTLGDPEITTIFGFVPSTAYDYATKHGYDFVQLDGCEYGYHSYEVASQVYATCESAGSITYQCTGCSEGCTETIDALGHDIYETITEPTCTQEGYILENCTRCGYIKLVSTIDRLEHNYVSFTVSPTCTEQGYTEYSCHGCGDSYIVDYTDPTGHNYIPETYHATCTEDGYTRWVCHGCSDSYVTDYITASGHNYTPQVVSPTCTEGGYTIYRCEGCGDNYNADYSEPTGHNYQSVVFYPTCTEGGYTNVFCEGCGDSYNTDFTDPTGHHYDAFTMYPTCTEDGYTTYICICGDSYISDYTEPTGHIYMNGYCIDCGRPNSNGGATSPFSDVSEGSWYKSAVDYAVAKGLMNGTGNNKFEPNTPMSRAMLVTVLWRYEGEPSGYVNIFTDIKESQWYTDAVAWAAANGIVGGVGNSRFSPNGNITREQLATILFRYCSSVGIDTSARADLSAFPDSAKISPYAKDAISWAVSVGLITGTKVGNSTYLDPQGNATRAQVATILMRFIENIASAGEETPSGGGYGAVVQEMMEVYDSNAEGLLYDIDGNGVLELVLIFHVSANPDDPYGMPVTAYSVFTMQDETVIPLIENQTLYAHAGGSQGWVGVVEMGGEQFFAAYCEGGEVGWLYGGWEIYRISDSGIGLQTKVDYLRVTDENDAIDYAQSYSNFNGERFGYEAYESWASSVMQIAVIDGSCNNLEALLAQLS